MRTMSAFLPGSRLPTIASRPSALLPPRRLEDGRRVYFDATVEPYGSMAERTLVPSDAFLDVAEGVDDVVAAALGNTGLAAWLSLRRGAGLREGETVLVLGATGAVGGIAVQAAKVLGAGRVVAAALADPALDRL